MCGISMETFTWQVVATFFAALAAAYVGSRQVGIAAGQRDIAKSQAKTAAAAFEIVKAQALTAKLAQRSALFDRRFEVYSTVQNYMRVSMNRDAMLLLELDKKIKEALDRSRFLFPDAINQRLLAALDLADEVAYAHEELSAKGDEKSKAKLRDLRETLRGNLKGLSRTMGTEMRLHFDEDE